MADARHSPEDDDPESDADAEDGGDSNAGSENGGDSSADGRTEAETGAGEATGGERGELESDDFAELSTEELRERVEEKYDFDDFGPSDMAEMSATEWEVVFDPETWITGETLLDRVEDELRSSVAGRDIFAVVERVGEGDDDRVVAYSDEGYAIVRPDGSIVGTGTILRDVEPTVALCAMEDYEVTAPPEDAGLPHPESVPEQSGDFGNRILQLVAGVTLLSGVLLLAAWIASVPGFVDLGAAGAIVATLGIVFALLGLFLFVTVANARLSDRMRSAQYRDRLEAVGAGSEERPPFLPDEAFEEGGRELEEAMERVHREALERTDR